MIHLIALEIADLSGLLADVGNRAGGGDQARMGVDEIDGDSIAVKSRNFH